MKLLPLLLLICLDCGAQKDTVASNYGNVGDQRRTVFATPGSDSLDFSIPIRDTSKCYLLVLKNSGKSNFIYAYEVTEFNRWTKNWDHVAYLKENGEVLRKKRVIFVESLR